MDFDGELVGELQITYGSAIIVRLTRWNGECCLDIRKHINSRKYAGLTVQGIRVHGNALRGIIRALTSIDFAHNSLHDKIIGVVAKSFDIDLAISIRCFMGAWRVDIREVINRHEKTYITRKGVAIPISRINEFTELLQQGLWLLESISEDQTKI